MTAGTIDGTTAGTATAGSPPAATAGSAMRRCARGRVRAALLGAVLVATLAACGGEAPAPSGEPSASNGPTPSGAWTYTSSPDGGERTATLTGPDGTLKFRTSPGRPPSGTLELARADISCPPDCTFFVAVDETDESWPVITDESPTSAASFADPGRLWEKVTDTRTLTLSYPRGESAVGTATFDATGADRAAMPGL